MQIGPICTNIDEILTRMDEFESSISSVSDNNLAYQHDHSDVSIECIL